MPWSLSDYLFIIIGVFVIDLQSSIGESSCFPLMWPRFDFVLATVPDDASVEFVGFLLCAEWTFSGYLSFLSSPKSKIWSDCLLLILVWVVGFHWPVIQSDLEMAFFQFFEQLCKARNSLVKMVLCRNKVWMISFLWLLLCTLFFLQRPGHEEATIKDNEDLTVVCDLLSVREFAWFLPHCIGVTKCLPHANRNQNLKKINGVNKIMKVLS